MNYGKDKSDADLQGNKNAASGSGAADTMWESWNQYIEGTVNVIRG